MRTGDAVRKRITELREMRGMSKYALTRAVDLAPSTVKSVLSGKSKDPLISTITLICAGLDVTIREFYNSELFEDPDMAEEDALKRE